VGRPQPDLAGGLGAAMQTIVWTILP